MPKPKVTISSLALATSLPGDVEVDDLAAAVLVALGWTPPTAKAELTEAQKHAERILRSAIDDTASDWGGIGDALDDEYKRHGQEYGDRLREQVDKEISAAKVTVTFPQPTGEDVTR